METMETKFDRMVNEFAYKFKELNADGKSAYVLIVNDSEKDSSILSMQGIGGLIAKAISTSMRNEPLDRVIRMAIKIKDNPLMAMFMDMMNKETIKENEQKEDSHE